MWLLKFATTRSTAIRFMNQLVKRSRGGEYLIRSHAEPGSAAHAADLGEALRSRLDHQD